eukprot:4134013-Pleurochrysis_carterae.AAC.1
MNSFPSVVVTLRNPPITAGNSITPVQALGPPPPLILATHPKHASSPSPRHTAICHTPHLSVSISLVASGPSNASSCRHSAGSVSLYPLIKSGCSVPSGVTSMSQSAPVEGVTPNILVKCAKMSPSAGKPLSDARMILTSGAPSGVPPDEREVERV